MQKNVQEEIKEDEKSPESETQVALAAQDSQEPPEVEEIVKSSMSLAPRVDGDPETEEPVELDIEVSTPFLADKVTVVKTPGKR